MAPGTFLIITGILAAIGGVMWAAGLDVWSWIPFGIALLVFTQVFVAWVDCSRTTCPKCQAPAKVRPWSL